MVPHSKMSSAVRCRPGTLLHQTCAAWRCTALVPRWGTPLKSARHARCLSRCAFNPLVFFEAYNPFVACLWQPVVSTSAALRVNTLTCWVESLHVAVQDSTQPVDLAAAKSRAGHAEACAGAVGLVFATRRLLTCATAPIAHLQSANAHVSSILDASKTRAAALLPREQGPGTCGAQWHAGISAFAFQVLRPTLAHHAHSHMKQLGDICVSAVPTCKVLRVRIAQIFMSDPHSSGTLAC